MAPFTVYAALHLILLSCLLNVRILAAKNCGSTPGDENYGAARKFFNCFKRKMDDKKSDLIILLYSEDWLDGWKLELRFIRSLLSWTKLQSYKGRIEFLTYYDWP